MGKGGGGSREGTTTQEGMDPGIHPLYAPGGRSDDSFHWLGARVQGIGPYPQRTA